MKRSLTSLIAIIIVIAIASCKKNSSSNSGTTPTPIPTATAPILGTLAATVIHQNSADFTASITSDGGSPIIQHGICWKSTPQPTINDPRTMRGTGTGTFGGTASALTSNAMYYVRAYATNGVGTTYSNEVSFTTVESFVSDIEGNVYSVIEIGTLGKFWTKQNLKTTKYRNGESISTGLSSSQWISTTSGAYAIYNNTSLNNSTYGKLYNGYAAKDLRGICPNGYHVATRDDMNYTVTQSGYLAPSGNPGGAMKATTLWNSPNTGATDLSGFSGLPAGIRSGSGSAVYFGIGDFGVFWSQTQNVSGGAYNLTLMHNSTTAVVSTASLNDGYSCRCVRD